MLIIYWHVNASPSLKESALNSLIPRQNARFFVEDIFNYIFLNENSIFSLRLCEACSRGCYWQSVIGSDNGLSSNKPLSEPIFTNHSKNKVVKWTTLGLSNWCQKRTPQSRPKLVIWVSRRMTTLMSSQKQPESRQMTTFLLASLSYDDLVITLERLNDKPQIVKWWSCD